MKTLRLHTVIAGIICFTSMHTYGMGENNTPFNAIMTTITNGLTTVVTNASRGIQNMVYGHTELLIDAIRNNTVDCDETKRNHQLDWAVLEQLRANNIEKLCGLLALVEDHNTKRACFAIQMSPQCEQQTKKPIEEYYATLKAGLITKTESDMDAMIKRWQLEHKELAALMFVEQSKIETVAKTIAFVHGVTPDNHELSKKLEELLVTKRYNQLTSHSNQPLSAITITSVPVISTDYDILATHTQSNNNNLDSKSNVESQNQSNTTSSSGISTPVTLITGVLSLNEDNGLTSKDRTNSDASQRSIPSPVTNGESSVNTSNNASSSKNKKKKGGSNNNLNGLEQKNLVISGKTLEENNE